MKQFQSHGLAHGRRPGDFGGGARKRRRVEDDTDWEPAESPTSSLGGGEWRPSRAERVAARQRVLENSAGQSTAVPQVPAPTRLQQRKC